MKKSNFITTLLFTLLVVLSGQVNAQNFSDLDKSPMDVASYPDDYKKSDKVMKIVYSRPQLKGRELSKLAPNGKVWRTGANEATELTLYTDMMMGGTKVKAGTYTFYTIPGDTEWTAIISSDLNVWGSYFYDEASDVARVTVPIVASEDELVAFSIALTEGENGVDMHLGWGKVRVKVPFTK